MFTISMECFLCVPSLFPITPFHVPGLQHNATANALVARSSPAKRPFVLSRAFFAGSQRISATWTGDNLGTWEHMAVGIPMVLSNGIAGMVFSGGVYFITCVALSTEKLCCRS